jgi:PAS domain S-box-containing protein
MAIDISTNISKSSDSVHPAAALAPAEPWVDIVEPHAHSVQFYGDDAFLLDELSGFVGSALGAGDAAVVIATRTHRDGLARRLEERGLNISLAVAQGRYVALDAAETLSKFMHTGQPDPALFTGLVGGIVARAAGAAMSERPRVAAFGEMVSLLWAEGKPEAAIRLEQLWNDLARTHAFDLRCAYPMSLFDHSSDGEPLATICSAHSSVIPAESYTSLAGEDERLRAITFLQQKARALETEMEERRKVQESLLRREAELADFLENALEGVQQVDAAQVVVWANKAMLDLLGYAPKEYIGHPLSEFCVHEHALDQFWRSLMRREDIYDYPAELRSKDGSSKHVLIHSNGLWEEDPGGDDCFVHARCFVRDVTDHKRMEQALLERNLELREAITIRDEFVSVAAHELKTPVTSLRGFAQLLLRDFQRKGETSPERLHAALNAIDQQTGKLTGLVSRLLDTAQIEAGKLRIEPVSTDLAALVRSVLAQQEGSANHTLVFDGPEHLEALVDPVRFEQVLTNLLDNAIKFSPRGGIVTVALGHGEDGGARLSVTDQGVGIAPAKREAIFDRFHQAHDEHHLSGMGLGLYIAREIIELHGGHIQLEEPERPGSRFVVTLPPMP